MKFFDYRINFLQVFAASFFRFDVQCATKGNHIPQIANMTGWLFWIFGLFKHSFPNLQELRFDARRVDIDTFAEGFSEELELLGDRFHR